MDVIFLSINRVFFQSPWAFLAWPTVGMLVATIFRYLLGKRVEWFAIQPRRGQGLLGILTAPFIHDNFSHLLANLPPFLLLGGLVLRHGVQSFLETATVLFSLSGSLLWIFGRRGSHVGMSGVIFGFLGYLLGLAYFSKEFWDLFIAVIVLVFYGGMLAGMKPVRNSTSWEGHLFGFIAGLGKVWLDHW
jgi:membrane associated rhomboid family serine protease